jgi:4-amino-4-deoxy-L-arabinose transferase-like glycosyltransferase
MSRRARWAGAGLLLVALGLRLGFVASTRHMPVLNDPQDYHRLAVSIAHGHGFGTSALAAAGGPTAFRPPAYPLFLGAVYAVFGVHIDLARGLQAGVGVLTVVLLGLLALELFDRRAAWVVTGIAVLYPPLVLAGGALVSESIFLPIEIGALLLAVRVRHGKSGRLVAAAAGLLAGIATLTRPTGIILVAVVALLVWQGPRRWGVLALRVPAFVALAAVVVIVPWTLRNEARFHRLLPIGDFDGYDLAGVYNDYVRHVHPFPAHFRTPNTPPDQAVLFRDKRLDEAQLSEALRSRALKYAKDNPSYVGTVMVSNLASLYDVYSLRYGRIVETSLGYPAWTADVQMVAFFILVACAIVGAFGRRARATPVVFWVVPIVGFTVATVFLLGTSRYRLPIEPFVVLLAGAALTTAWETRYRSAEAAPA